MGDDPNSFDPKRKGPPPVPEDAVRTDPDSPSRRRHRPRGGSSPRRRPTTSRAKVRLGAASSTRKADRQRTAADPSVVCGGWLLFTFFQLWVRLPEEIVVPGCPGIAGIVTPDLAVYTWSGRNWARPLRDDQRRRMGHRGRDPRADAGVRAPRARREAAHADPRGVRDLRRLRREPSECVAYFELRKGGFPEVVTSRSPAQRAAGARARSALAALALAQSTMSEATVPLATGFVPDPVEIEGHTHGARSLGSRGVGVPRLRRRAPSHVMASTRASGSCASSRRATSTSSSPCASSTAPGTRAGCTATIASATCQTSKACSRAGARGRSGSARTRSRRQRATTMLHFTETRSIRPGVGAAGDDPHGGDRARPRRRRPGPSTGSACVAASSPIRAGSPASGRDQHQKRIPMRAWPRTNRSRSRCSATAAAASSTRRRHFIVTLREDFDFLQLYLCGAGDETHCTVPTEPLSLVVLMPDGTFRCGSRATRTSPSPPASTGRLAGGRLPRLGRRPLGGRATVPPRRQRGSAACTEARWPRAARSVTPRPRARSIRARPDESS